METNEFNKFERTFHAFLKFNSDEDSERSIYDFYGEAYAKKIKEKEIGKREPDNQMCLFMVYIGAYLMKLGTEGFEKNKESQCTKSQSS